MEYRDRVIADISENLCKCISRKTIRCLQQMKDVMQSGDDSALKNTWDEICVQLQSDYSTMWFAYEDTIKAIIDNAVKEVDIPMLQAIWLQTQEGWDWESELEDSEKVPIPYCYHDIVQYILNDYVLSAATDWTNKRIRKYLDKEE